MTNNEFFLNQTISEQNARLFESIAEDIVTQGYSISSGSVPNTLIQNLWQHLQTQTKHQFKPAGIGRSQGHQIKTDIRSDKIAWIEADFNAGKAWIEWTSLLQIALNRRLFLGLSSFESHFAHYQAGDFYQRHIDAFKGKSNRVLSLVLYLNPNWQAEFHGELVLYNNQNDSLETETENSIKVLPEMGTLVVFLSEEFPHEVLPATKDRYSIAGWFRANHS